MAIVTSNLERNTTDSTFENGAILKNKETLKKIVAADCLLPACEKLFDLNIFSVESGLSGDAHVKFYLDTLSKENKQIILDLCKERPDLCQIQNTKDAYIYHIINPNPNQHYPDMISAKCEYEGLNLDEQIVADRLLKIVSVLQPQDVYCVDKKIYGVYQRYSLKGLNENIYLRETVTVYPDLKEYLKGKDLTFEDIIDLENTKPELFAHSYEVKDPDLTIEQAIEKYCTGKDPQFIYDNESKSFFISKEILNKSIEFRKKLNKVNEKSNN